MKTSIRELKANCRSTFRNAVIRGDIKIGPCSVCGTTVRIEAHHEDYTKPLEVIYFCKKHHNEHHFGVNGSKKCVYDSEVVKLRVKSKTMDKIRIVAGNQCRKYTDQINYILNQWVNNQEE